MNNFSSLKIIFFSFILLASSTAINAQYYGNQNEAGAKIGTVLDAIHYAYVDTVNDKQLAEAAIVAMLKELDPHSVYIPAEELKEMNEPLVGNFEGIGIQFNILFDTIMVTGTIPGGPSEKLGIMAGDKIIKIEDTLVAGVSFKNNDVIKKLRGNKGTKVKVSILRRGQAQLIDFVITRDKIPIFSIDAAYMAAPEIGYIKVNRFAETTTEEFREALSKVKAKGAKNLILDLTGNGGGYLNRAIEMTDEFLSANKLIVYTNGRVSPRQDVNSTSTGGFEQGKLIVLIDEGSASASEIVSGAIQDWDRGLIIGRRSFGKGLVQKPIPLPDGSALRLTIARYYTPSGRSIQKPYDDGVDAYEKDLLTRYKHGEFTTVDSISFPDSLKYLTSNKRTVYGGGGIMPDIFVALDTTQNSEYFNSVLRKGIVNQFSLDYTDRHRKELTASYADVEKFRTGFVTDEVFMKEFTDFANREGVELNEENYKTSYKMMSMQLKALVARNLWDLEAYYFIINETNPAFKKAMESFKDKTFEKMKIVSR